MEVISSRSSGLVSTAVLLFALLAVLSSSLAHASVTRHYKFDVKLHKVRRLCHTKTVLTVNGKFPGQPIVAREGDRVLIKVTNHVKNNVSFHWHGVRQLRSGWADGPAYITQCPIQTNNTYVYNFTITGQRGTLWWHAHISWLRATMYGPIVILPRRHESYPFPKPHKEVTIMLGEWWNNDTQAVITQALQTGAGPNTSDAYTFNGFPGPSYNSCSDPNDTYKLKVQPGKTYLIRLINAALMDELFFSIANHTFTIVETDASYTKPFTTSTLLITPGQTTNILLKTKPNPSTSTYLMAIRPYFSGTTGTFDNTTAIAFLEYKTSPPLPTPPSLLTNATLTAMLPSLPSVNDTSFVANFTSKLRSLNTPSFPATVPQSVDKHFFFTVGLGTNPCPNNKSNCQGPTNTTKFAASINNVSFALPSTALLPTYYKYKTMSNGGVFTTDFPSMPLHKFNYTGTPPNNTNVINGTTKVEVLKFNTSVELVMQDTSIITAESHPLHLHGYNVFIVGQGFGNFDPINDPKKYNLVDPLERNTVPVPAGGWVAVRFRADNPGIWFMHCHIEVHLSWGLTMAWLVLDGDQPNQKLPPPPADLPKC